jgi:hypothetical protein
MDRLTSHQETIKQILRERQLLACPSLPAGLEVTCLCDDVSGQYALLTVGWMQRERVCGATLLLRIKNGQIWIEADETDAPVAEDLVHAGVSPHDIVLGFQPPEMRAQTAFAAA